MFRLLALVFLSVQVAAAETPRFRFQPGETLEYAAEQNTTVREVAPAGTITSTVKLAVTRRWEVVAVDPAGVATLTLTITSLKQTITRDGGAGEAAEPIVVDSTTPEGQTALADVLGKPLLKLKLTATGELAEVESLNEAGTGRVAAELPFRVVFPTAAVNSGATWERPCVLTLDPPQGAGETVKLVQKFTLHGEKSGYLVIGMQTDPVGESVDPAARLGPIPVLWAGEVYFDPARGRYAGARLQVQKEVADAAGPGTLFQYTSTYTETQKK